MVTVRVLGETPEEEFEEVAERAYRRVPRSLIDEAQTETELSQVLIDKYFYEKGYAKLMPGIVKAFKKKGYWEEPEVIIPMAPEVPEERPLITGRPLKIEEEKPVKITKPKVVKVKLSKTSSDADIEQYVDSRPSRAKKGQIYKVTKGRKSIKKEVYVKRIKNLIKGWNKPRQKKTA